MALLCFLVELIFYDNLSRSIAAASGSVDRKNVDIVASKFLMTLKDEAYRFSENHYNAEEFLIVCL